MSYKITVIYDILKTYVVQQVVNVEIDDSFHSCLIFVFTNGGNQNTLCCKESAIVE